MTTNAELIARLRSRSILNGDYGSALDQAADAIEALEAQVETLRYEIDAVPAIKSERDALQAQLTAAQQAQPEPHLFEFWWAEYMPEATQEQAFKAWSAAPSSKGVGVEQQAQPEPECGNTPYDEGPFTIAQPERVSLIPCRCFDEVSKRLCLDKGKCVRIEAHAIKQGGQQ